MSKNYCFQLTLNGKYFNIFHFQQLTLHHLLSFFNYKINLIVVEYNGRIISPNFYKKTYILNNSNIEIVTIVGGG